MRRILAAAAAFSFLVPAFAEPPKQHLRPGDEIDEPGPAQPALPPHGATVLVPALVTDAAIGTTQPAKVIRLPAEAGRVSKMVTTNLIASASIATR